MSKNLSLLKKMKEKYGLDNVIIWYEKEYEQDINTEKVSSYRTGKTIVALCYGKDRYIGTSQCNTDHDTFSREKGRSIAIGRAILLKKCMDKGTTLERKNNIQDKVGFVHYDTTWIKENGVPSCIEGCPEWLHTPQDD